MNCEFADPEHLVVMITGGSKGLGLELVSQWMKRDNCKHIVVLDVFKSKDLEQLESENGTKLHFYCCDMADSQSVDKTYDEIFAKYKRIDVLICNSGVRQRERFLNTKEGEMRSIFEINYFSHVKLVRKAIHTSCEAAYRLHIVVVASVLGFIAPKTLCYYSGTKSCLIDLIDSIRHELRRSIALSVVAPGQLSTSMFQDVKIDNPFLAPLVNHKKLAMRIMSIIDEGYNGLFMYPFYCRLVPALRCMPFGIYEALRKYSKMDDII
ncbi:hypothetical protein FOA43_003469 [Brettanomyces nanus]|uniref:Uncharacterized protein n=1 Tax=Eeniella nana TaxID=13502 RepID=A0A875S584_EENNA|nr:uncharacterized protein FOA43_003469 [Brettanomyces nanus]QPG76083.1 hypothetical protein FOA43_003469 [Brettanomyces nanus]